MKKIVCIFCLVALCACFAQNTGLFVMHQDPENPDCIYDRAKLGDCIIHMIKITSLFKGSAPVIEMLQNSYFKWMPSGVSNGWGKNGKTFCYYEEIVPGTQIFFSITNKLSDIQYYRTDFVHPCQLSIYEEPEESRFLERFIFFKFTAYADKGGCFENYLDNFLYALDTHTKLLYSYGMPTDFKKIIGNNYIPLNWQPYETAANTKGTLLKFYEYDPVGFVSLEYSYEFSKIKTNMHIYKWWYDSIAAGQSMEDVKAKRFMPALNPDAEKDWSVRDAKRPVVSPYRKY